MSVPGAAPAAAPAAPSSSGGVSVALTADKTSATVGDPLVLTIRIRHPKDVVVLSIDADRALQAATVLDQKDETPRPLPDGGLEEVRRVTVALYETGRKEIAPPRVTWHDAAGHDGSTAAASGVAIDVASILTPGQNEPADIKRPAAMPERLLWPFVVAGVVLLLAAAAYLLWRRRRGAVPAAAPVLPPPPPRPAHEIAYQELERLLSSGLLEQGRVKEFYIEFAAIVRRYLAARYGIDTFERTTYEVLEALRAHRLPVRASALAADVMGASDLVKFARYDADRDETRHAVENAYRLIDETRAPDAPPAAESAAAGRAGDAEPPAGTPAARRAATGGAGGAA